MKAEGGVFVCSWKNVRGRVKVWVKRRPRLTATGKSFGEADEALGAIIAAHTGDGENLREYSPAVPSLAASREVLGVVSMVSGEGRTIAQHAEELFAGGLCPQCSCPRGRRAKTELSISPLRGLGDGGAARLTRDGLGSTLAFFSQEFLSLLTAKERRLFEWREVSSKGRGGKKFYELVGADFHVPFAVLAGGTAELWTCDTCGWENAPFYGLSEQFPEWLIEVADGRWDDLPSWFVSAADVANSSTCFAVGRAPEFRLCFSASRWQELVGRAGTRGLKSYDIGIIEPNLLEPRPRRLKHSVVWK